MELEEQDRREILERQKEDMIRQIAGATGQSAQMLRAMNHRRFNATPNSLIDDRSDEVNNLAQLLVDDHQAEQERLLQERLDLMRQQVNQGMVWGLIVIGPLEWQECVFHHLFYLNHFYSCSSTIIGNRISSSI